MTNMTKVFLGLVLAATVAQAQTTTTTTTETTATTATAEQTTTATAAAVAPAAKSPVGLNVFFEFIAGAKDLKEQNNKAMVDSYNGIGATYKISDVYKAELRHNYQMRIISDRDQLKAPTKKVSVNKLDSNGKPVLNEKDEPVMTEVQEFDYASPYLMNDPTIHLNATTKWTLLGSKPLSIASRYYIPMSKASVNSNSLGVLRTQTSAVWSVTTKFDVSLYGQFRLYLNRGNETDKGRARGADSEFRYIVGPSLTWNFTDSVSAYYSPYFDLRTTGHQRGQFTKAEVTNDLYQDIGMSISAGNFFINPYWSTQASAGANSQTYVGYGKDENSSYGLFVQAVY